MKITNKGVYALKAMLYLMNEANSKALTSQDISEKQGIPKAFLDQILRKLRLGGLIASVRGPGGGYAVVKNPEDITVSEVLGLVGERLNYLVKLDSEDSSKEDKAISGFFKEVGEQLNAKLDSKVMTLNRM